MTFANKIILCDLRLINVQEVHRIIHLDLQTQFFKPRPEHLRQLIVSKLCLVECSVQVIALTWLNPTSTSCHR